MTLDEAHIELLDHLGEDVHVVIVLPGDVPWAGCHGTLGHHAHQLMDDLAGDRFCFDDDDRELHRRWAELLLRRGGRDELFMVDEFSFAARREQGHERAPDGGTSSPRAGLHDRHRAQLGAHRARDVRRAQGPLAFR